MGVSEKPTCFPPTYALALDASAECPASLRCSTTCKVGRQDSGGRRPPSHVESYPMGTWMSMALALKRLPSPGPRGRTGLQRA